MNTIEEFSKNRISFSRGEIPKAPKIYDDRIRFEDVWYCGVKKEICLLELNITNAIKRILN